MKRPSDPIQDEERIQAWMMLIEQGLLRVWRGKDTKLPIHSFPIDLLEPLSDRLAEHGWVLICPPNVQVVGQHTVGTGVRVISREAYGEGRSIPLPGWNVRQPDPDRRGWVQNQNSSLHECWDFWADGRLTCSAYKRSPTDLPWRWVFSPVGDEDVTGDAATLRFAQVAAIGAWETWTRRVRYVPGRQPESRSVQEPTIPAGTFNGERIVADPCPFCNLGGNHHHTWCPRFTRWRW